MFKRKNGVLAFLLVAVMLLGVGFAAVTDNLTINSKAIAAVGDNTPVQVEFDGKVGFSACTEGTDTDDKTAEAYNTLPDTVSFEATNFAKVGDKKTITYTVSNTHADLAATLSAITVTAKTGSGEYFSVEANASTNELAAETGTATITVTVEMVKTPIDNVTEEFTLTFTATASEAE